MDAGKTRPAPSGTARTRTRSGILVDEVRESPVDHALEAGRRRLLMILLVTIVVLWALWWLPRLVGSSAAPDGAGARSERARPQPDAPV